MGYYMSMSKRQEFFLAAKDQPKALARLNKLGKQYDISYFSVEHALSDSHFHCILDRENNITAIYFDNMKYETDILEELAPFVKEDSFITVITEDRQRHLWRFKKGKLVIQKFLSHKE